MELFFQSNLFAYPLCILCSGLGMPILLAFLTYKDLVALVKAESKGAPISSLNSKVAALALC